MPYRNTTDEALVRLWRSGCDEAEVELIRRYLPKIRAYASRFRFSGMERDDLVQEGLIGFIKAISAYQENVSPVFSAFAGTCFRNNIKSAAARALGDICHLVTIVSEILPIRCKVPFLSTLNKQ